MPLVVINRHLDRPVFRLQLPQQFQARPYHGEPLAVFQIVLVMLEGRPRVIRRVNIDPLHLAGIKRQRRFQRLQIIPLDQQVPCLRFPRAKPRRLLQQPIRRAARRTNVLVSRQPVQSGDGLIGPWDFGHAFFVFGNPLVGFFFCEGPGHCAPSHCQQMTRWPVNVGRQAFS